MRRREREMNVWERFLMRAWELMSGRSIRENESKQQANTEQSNRQTKKTKRWWIMSGKWKLMRKWSGGGLWGVRRLGERGQRGVESQGERRWREGWRRREKSEQAKRGGGCCFKISADECVSPLWGGVPSALYVCHSTRLCLALRERALSRWCSCVWFCVFLLFEVGGGFCENGGN